MKGIIAFLVLINVMGCTGKDAGIQEASQANTGNDFDVIDVRRVNKAGITMANTFPFSQAAKVEIISFPEDKFRLTETEQTYDIVDGKMQFDESIILQRIVLDNKQKEVLFGILYDYKKKDEFHGADCYRPNHRILFYDDKQRIIAFLEICFICEGYKLSAGFKPEELYHDKFTQLETFFKSVGVNHFFEEGE